MSEMIIGVSMGSLIPGADTAAPSAPTRLLLLKDGDIGWANMEGVTLDGESAGKLIARFKAHGAKLPIDWEHSTVHTEESGQGQAPAAGWITALEYRKGVGLIGTVEWNDDAREQIEDGSYKYFSPVVYSHKKTGKVEILHSVALTNRPRTIGQAELLKQAASDAVGSGDVSMERQFTFKKGSDLRMIAAQEDVVEEFPAVSEDSEAIIKLRDALVAAGAELDEAASLTAIINAAIDMLAAGTVEGEEEEAAAASAAKLVETLKLEVGAGKNKIVGAVTALAARHDLLQGRYDETAKELAELQGERKSTRVDALIAKQVAANKLNPNDAKQMAAARTLADESEEQFAAFCGALTPYAEPGETNADNVSPKDERGRLIKAAAKEYTSDEMMQVGGTACKHFVNGELISAGYAQLTESETEALEKKES